MKRAKLLLPTLTHAQLVDIAARWLRRRCAVVTTETQHLHGEEFPDAIGWRTMWGDSWMIECKASRGDFLRDRHKPFRKGAYGIPFGRAGMGERRFYLAERGLIAPDELPARWGLLEVGGQRVFETVNAKPFFAGDAPEMGRDLRAEVKLLLSLMAQGKGVQVQADTPLTLGFEYEHP